MSNGGGIPPDLWRGPLGRGDLPDFPRPVKEDATWTARPWQQVRDHTHATLVLDSEVSEFLFRCRISCLL